MPSQDQEKQLIMVAVGVVFFSIVAVAAFILGAGSVIFYICAVIAIALGFYLSYTLSQEGRETTNQQSRRKK